MIKSRISILRSLALTAILLLALIITAFFTANVAYAVEVEDVSETEVQDIVTTYGTGDEEPEPVRNGLTVEDGKIYYYNEDGTLFTEGYKEVTVDGSTYYYFFQEDGTAFTGGYKPFSKNGTRVYYYFQEDGTAYTDGYLNFVVDGKNYYFYFQDDGSAFTGGYKEITIDGKLYYFYFLANGQGFNTGYKTVMIDGKKFYYYFGSNGRAVTNTMESISLGERTAYMLFNEDGKAFTNGYKEINNAGKVDYYYFLTNGQAFTTGYKTVKIDGATYYFYFEANGKAYTNGLKEVPFGTQSYYYFFHENGRAEISGWETINEKDYYFQANGRAAKETFVTIDDSIYYFDDSFDITTGGWFCVGKAYYYAAEDGKLSTDTVIEGYKLDSAGKCTTKYRIIKYVNEHTDPSMTDQEKIEALYNWVLRNSMKYIRTYEHTKADWVWKDSWVDDMAASQMDKWGGNCFRYAAFFGMLVREATGLEVTVYHGYTPGANVPLTPHGWVTVNQGGTLYAYDVELQKHSGYSRARCYKVPYSESSKSLHVQGVGTNLY